MTASQRRFLARSAAQERAGLPGPTPAVNDAPTMAIVGTRPGARSIRCSQAVN